MKRVVVLVLSILMGGAYGQMLDTQKPPCLVENTAEKDGVKRVFYDIKCSFAAELTPDQQVAARAPESWKVRGMEREYEVREAGLRLDRKTCILRGDWDRFDDLIVQFKGSQGVQVSADTSQTGTASWGFGKGKAIDLNIRRLQEKALYAFDYSFDVKALKRRLPVPKPLTLLSLSFDVDSRGTLAGDEATRNGTETSLGLSANAYYFLGGLMYNGELGGAYQMETKVDTAKDELLEIANKTLKFGVKLEIPYTNRPMYRLHARTGYARMAMPLTLSLDYLPKGKDAGKEETPARVDFKSVYELAFSPYLIVKAKWNCSRFLDTPPTGDKTATYYELVLAQELSVLGDRLGFLGLLAGDSDKASGQNFIFFKTSSGRAAPIFQKIDGEKSIGFGVYF